MGDWIAEERRGRGPSFSSALLEAISRATESSQDEFSLPNKPKLRIDEHLSFKYNSINALQVPTGSSSSSRRCCCGSSSCKRGYAPTSTSNPRPAYARQEAEVMPKVKEPSPKLKPSKAVSPGSKLASILNSVLVSSWSKSKSQRQELKGVSDCSSNSTSSTSSYSLFARSMSSSTPASTSSSLHKPKSKDHYQHASRPSKKSSETPPSNHSKHKYSSSSTSSASYNKYSSSSTSSSKYSSSSTSSASYNKHSSSSTSSASYNKSSSSSTSSAAASANKEKNAKIRIGMIFEKDAAASSLRNYSTKVSNSRNLDEEYADSDSSSDLFELNSIYSRDLPVYETTHLETNKAIARGLL